MKILILSQYWYPENGVPQRRWSWLSKLLVRAGHEVTVIAPPPHYERSESLKSWFKDCSKRSYQFESGPSGERILRSNYLPAGQSLTFRALNQGTVAVGMLWSAFRRKGDLRGYKPDLIVGTVPAIPTAIATPAVATLLRSPYVIDLRDAWPDLLTARTQWNSGTGSKSSRERILSCGPVQLVSKLVEVLMYRSFRSASGLIVTSKSLEIHLLERPQLKGRRPVTATIRNVFPPKTEYWASDKRDRACDTLHVLYAGTLGRAQKLTNALDAAKIAQRRGVNVKLRFVGAGATRTELQRKIDEEEIPAEIWSRVPAEELTRHYDWADSALVHLTDWEALDRAIPSKAYELMASGIHITGVVSGEAAEIIRCLGVGDVVSPSIPEELAELWIALAHDRSRLSMSAAGRDWVENQRDEQAPAELVAFLEKLKERA